MLKVPQIDFIYICSGTQAAESRAASRPSPRLRQWFAAMPGDGCRSSAGGKIQIIWPLRDSLASSV